jgi:hypothetical protein
LQEQGDLRKFDKDSWKASWAGKDGTKITQGVSGSIGFPVEIPGIKEFGIKGSVSQSFRAHMDMYDDTWVTDEHPFDPELDIFATAFKFPKSKEVEEKIKTTTNAFIKKPEVKLDGRYKINHEKSFIGLDLGVTGQLFVGGTLNLKIGFENDNY